MKIKYKLGDKFRVTKNLVGQPNDYSLFTLVKINKESEYYELRYNHSSWDTLKTITHAVSFKELHNQTTFIHINNIKTILPLP